MYFSLTVWFLWFNLSVGLNTKWKKVCYCYQSRIQFQSSNKSDLFLYFLLLLHLFYFTYNMHYCCCFVIMLHLTLPVPQTIVHQALLSIGFPRQEYWSGFSFPFPVTYISPVLIRPWLINPPPHFLITSYLHPKLTVIEPYLHFMICFFCPLYEKLVHLTAFGERVITIWAPLERFFS